METPAKRPPKRREDRIILQFDYDCFYAQVFENKHPHLKSKPLGVRQKNILATCNYHARANGVRKLMLVAEARRVCPALVLVDGEDLSPFRDVSKTLYRFLKSHSWNGKVERLGFDEVFMDVTDMVDYNLSCLARGSLARSFFQLSRSDPEAGFACDLGGVAGPVLGGGRVDPEDAASVRLALGSHLAMHLRGRIEREFGYTSTCGVATNKLLSKLCGGKNKPSNQTTLLARTDDDVLAFMDGHRLRDVPGVGFKTARLIEAAVTGVGADADADDGVDAHTFRSTVTVGEARLHPAVSPAALEKLLAGPGAERGVGARVWGLLHGVDAAEVKAGADVPSQLSIEDTYRGLETGARITEELFKLSCSLVRRMRVDLTTTSGGGGGGGARRWAARPRTLRLSIRSWPGRPQEGGVRGGGGGGFPGRVSRSAAVPRFLLDLEADVEAVAELLVAEALLPLLRRLGEAETGGGASTSWNLQLINVCVANMAAGAEGEDGEGGGGGGRYGAGRDIADMWRRQDEVLRPWKVVGEGGEAGKMEGRHGMAVEEEQGDAFEDGLDVDGSWRGGVGDECGICGLIIPTFAVTAHFRYHEMRK